MVTRRDPTTRVFAALADRTRRRILMGLARQGEAPVNSLARPFRISRPAISRHLRTLERAGLIGRRRRGRLHLIRVRAAGLAPVRQWMEQCAAGWQFSFDALDSALEKERLAGRAK